MRFSRAYPYIYVRCGVFRRLVRRLMTLRRAACLVLCYTKHENEEGVPEHAAGVTEHGARLSVIQQEHAAAAACLCLV